MGHDFVYVMSENGHEAVRDSFFACARNEKGYSACEESRFVSKPLAKTQSLMFSIPIVAKSLPPLHFEGRNTKSFPKSVKLTAYI